MLEYPSPAQSLAPSSTITAFFALSVLSSGPFPLSFAYSCDSLTFCDRVSRAAPCLRPRSVACFPTPSCFEFRLLAALERSGVTVDELDPIGLRVANSCRVFGDRGGLLLHFAYALRRRSIAARARCSSSGGDVRNTDYHAFHLPRNTALCHVVAGRLQRLSLASSTCTAPHSLTHRSGAVQSRFGCITNLVPDLSVHRKRERASSI